MRPALLLPAVLVITAACNVGDAGPSLPPCDPDDGGITLPEGFCAVVVADGLPRPRHLAVRDDGDLFVATYGGRRGDPRPGGVVALRDTTGDGRADVEVRFGPEAGGSGIALHRDYVYFGPDDGVIRYAVPGGALEPRGEGEVIVRDLPDTRSHRAKSMAITEAGALFVNVGSPSNSCQREDRTVGSPGLDPCPQLETRAGVWRFDASTPDQTQEDGVRYATGMRNSVALALRPDAQQLYAVIHGRDQLSQNWPDLYTTEEGAELPAEQFVRIEEGSDFGWPYCYYDWQAGSSVLAPEYGGDGDAVGRCADVDRPILGFPGHWGPNALLFYTGEQFPARCRGGAFVAFHGSWNRAPLDQEGYNVVFVPFENGSSTGEWQVFADGFAGPDVSPRGAEHRPTGLAQGPDGSLYVSDDAGGRIWRIMYRGM